jgi:plastocyanin
LLVVASFAFAADEVVVVSQRNRQFTPDHLIVAKGTVVRINNDDTVTHHVYIDTPQMSYDSDEQPVGHSISLTFDKSGTFPVRCAIHPTMHLDVTVK